MQTVFHMDVSILDLFPRYIVPPTYSLFIFAFPTIISKKGIHKLNCVFENPLCPSNFQNSQSVLDACTQAKYLWNQHIIFYTFSSMAFCS